MTPNLRQRAVAALAIGLESYRESPLCDQKGYVANLEHNLVNGVETDQFQQFFAEGAGQELEGKMLAAHSSSALAVNCFARWTLKPTSLYIADVTDFEWLQFEVKCPTGLVGRTPPHLDLIVSSASHLVAVESKCTEYLVKHRASFADAYVEQISDHRVDTGWYREMERLRELPQKYQFLDAAQLIKHYFGLAHTYPDVSTTLLYLYWEPKNASSFPEFTIHREEIECFADAVRGSAIDFRSQSYSEFWSSWSDSSEPSWLGDHVTALRARYEVSI